MAVNPTSAKLAAALGEIPGVPAVMVSRAEDGYYHDYVSPLTFPATHLVADLRELAALPSTPAGSRPRLRAMAADVVDGVYDASKEESDAWALSAEGRQAIRDLTDDGK
jgi:hypothetical protein